MKWSSSGKSCRFWIMALIQLAGDLELSCLWRRCWWRGFDFTSTDQVVVGNITQGRVEEEDVSAAFDLDIIENEFCELCSHGLVAFIYGLCLCCWWAKWQLQRRVNCCYVTIYGHLLGEEFRIINSARVRNWFFSFQEVWLIAVGCSTRRSLEIGSPPC